MPVARWTLPAPTPPTTGLPARSRAVPEFALSVTLTTMPECAGQASFTQTPRPSIAGLPPSPWTSCPLVGP